MLNSDFPEWLEQLQCQASASFHRQLVLMVGDAGWVKESLQLDEETNKEDSWLIYSNHPAITSTIDNKHFAQQLGRENSRILFSCVENKESATDETINLDAFAALSGTIIAAGVMFLWLEQPIGQAIKSTKLLSLQYFYQQLLDNKNLLIVEQSAEKNAEKWIKPELPALDDNPSIALQASVELSYDCKTQEQQTAVEHIVKVSRGHRNRPLVLTADRGRGKSSALAIACVQLLENNSVLGNEKLNIVITAPHVRSLSVFYRQLVLSFTEFQAEFEYVNTRKTSITHRFGSITFVAVDQLIHANNSLNVSLLLVDEAAAIPVHLLTQLTTRYSRIVFSSTVHGYEGAGRGFTLKFQQELQKLMPQWRNFHMHQPIRWRINDPLESFVFESCLLNAKLTSLPVLNKLTRESISERTLCFNKVSSQILVRNPELLQQVFSVLVTAHYQTSPNDIVLMLDNNAAHLLIAKMGDDIVGVALLLAEGCKNEDDIKAIVNNERRLKNQFIPQSLLTHCGFGESFDYQFLRIMRIAIHPQYHGCGFGHRFMKYLREYAKEQQVDFMGASFGANAQLLKFWQNTGYQVARIGFTKDQASGEHSALVISAISDRGQFFERKIINEFYHSFDYLLTDEYKTLSPTLVWQVLHHCPVNSLPKLSAHQLNSINDFSNQTRQFSHCVRALHYWCLLHCKGDYDPQFLLLIERILQKKTIETVCANQQLTGKKMLNKAIVDYISQYH